MAAASKTVREQEMREVIAQQLASGMTQRAFAASIGMKMGTFTWWKREITRRDRRRAEPPQEERAPTFLPVEVIDAAPATLTTPSPFVSVRVGDLHIDVPADFDAAHLGRVVAAVRAC